MKVFIPQDVIDVALQRSCRHCPIAVVINGMLSNGYKCRVGMHVTNIWDDDSCYNLIKSVNTTESMRKFMDTFDSIGGKHKTKEQWVEIPDLPQEVLKANKEYIFK